MTDKQKRFCDEYLVDCNGTRAYKAAYPNVKSDASAATASGRLLRNVEVSSYIAEGQKKIKSKLTADADEVREFFTAIMRSRTEETKDRVRSAEALAKCHGMFTEKVTVSVVSQQTIDEMEALVHDEERSD